MVCRFRSTGALFHGVYVVEFFSYVVEFLGLCSVIGTVVGFLDVPPITNPMHTHLQLRAIECQNVKTVVQQSKNLLVAADSVQKYEKQRRQESGNYATAEGMLRVMRHIGSNRCENCNNDASTLWWRKKKHAPDGSFCAADILKIMEAQNKACAICKCDISDLFEIDHIVPTSKGGSNKSVNLQLLCPPCNNTKGDNILVTGKCGKPVLLLLPSIPIFK